MFVGLYRNFDNMCLPFGGTTEQEAAMQLKGVPKETWQSLY